MAKYSTQETVKYLLNITRKFNYNRDGKIKIGTTST